MKKILIVSLLLGFFAVSHGLAGTLDGAPFKIVAPDKSWVLDDKQATDIGKGVSIVATLAKTGTTLKSVVIKTVIDNPSPASAADFVNGIKDSMANPAVKKMTEDDVIFVGTKAKCFNYEVTSSGQTTFCDTMVFVSGNIGWTVTCVGPLAEKDNVKEILSFYQKAGS